MSDMTEAPNLRSMAPPPVQSNFDLLSGITVRVSVEVGSASMTLSELLNLGEGAVIELDRQTNDVLDILANGTLIAKGEIVEIDGRYGVRIVDVIANAAGHAGRERQS